MPDTLTPARRDRLRGYARRLGCPDLIWLGAEPGPGHLEYLDLLPAKSTAPVLPEAVAEFQDRPLLYLVDGLDEAGAPRLQPRQVEDLQHLLANRSEHACLGVVKPDRKSTRLNSSHLGISYA